LTLSAPAVHPLRRLTTCLLVVCAAGEAGVAGQTRRPDLIVILADDLGYSDLGSFGGEIRTPHLDQLAQEGLRLGTFYATPRCSPSRAALLSGRHPHEVGVGHLNGAWSEPAYRGEIADDVALLPELLRDAGYRTYMAGKWHLAHNPDRNDPDPSPQASWPLQRGFDAFYGTLRGSGSYWDPPTLLEGNEPVAPGEGLWHYTDALADKAVRYLRRHEDEHADDPFFLYLSFTAPHWPLHALPADLESYEGHYLEGWDEIRRQRFERQKELGLFSETTTLPPADSAAPAWEQAGDTAWQAQRMQAYAAMVTAMDRAIGRVLGQLEASGRADDAIVIFASDNGASAEELDGVYLLAPLFMPVPESTRDGRPVRFGDLHDATPGNEETFMTYGRGWAQVSTTPFRLYKHWTHEGGLRVPFIVRWPGADVLAGGSIVDQPADLLDVLPTVLDLLDVSAPPAVSGELPGRSLRPALTGAELAERTFFWEHEGNRALRQGQWKLVSRWPGAFELYDLAADPTESQNLARQRPELVAELAGEWQQQADRLGVGRWPLMVPIVRQTLTIVGLLIVALFAVRFVLRSPRAPTQAPPAPSRPAEPAAPRARSSRATRNRPIVPR
jgi:arylsulfatase